MFVGHFALAFAAKRATPRLSLGVLIAAAQLADILWPFLLAAGLEHVRIDPGNTAATPLDFTSYPYSHSLLFLAIWGGLFGLACRAATARANVLPVVAGLVVSHWVLDVVTHGPDMPFYPGSVRTGLGLWNSIPLTLVVELSIFAAGLTVYLRSTRANDRIGSWGLGSLAGILITFYLSALFGPPPPSVSALIGVSIAGAALLTAWGWWIDAHRSPTTPV